MHTPVSISQLGPVQLTSQMDAYDDVQPAGGKLKLNVQQKAFLKSTLKMRQHLTQEAAAAEESSESKSSSPENGLDVERELAAMNNPM